jgi:hypothetical protein
MMRLFVRQAYRQVLHVLWVGETRLGYYPFAMGTHTAYLDSRGKILTKVAHCYFINQPLAAPCPSHEGKKGKKGWQMGHSFTSMKGLTMRCTPWVHTLYPT